MWLDVSFLYMHVMDVRTVCIVMCAVRRIK